MIRASLKIWKDSLIVFKSKRLISLNVNWGSCMRNMHSSLNLGTMSEFAWRERERERERERGKLTNPIHLLFL